MKRARNTVFFLLIGTLVGFVLKTPTTGSSDKSNSVPPVAAALKHTCSMHPQIVMDHPDICPLCGMDLTPVQSGGGGWEDEDPASRLVLSPAARKMADVGSVEVRERALFKEIRTVGKVELDETRVASVSARVSGPARQVYADVPGTRVTKGTLLVSICSTEMFAAQQQFLIARRQDQFAIQLPTSPASGSVTTRLRLHYLGMSDEQIEGLARSEKPMECLELCAPIDGTIIEKQVRVGQFVEANEVLFTIADLSRVWLILDIYESELSWVQLGQPVEITLESDRRSVTGNVGFIEPVLNDTTRTARVRVFLDNPGARFMPGMYAQATLRIPIQTDGRAATSIVPSPPPAQRNSGGEGRVRGGEHSSAARHGVASPHASDSLTHCATHPGDSSPPVCDGDHTDKQSAMRDSSIMPVGVSETPTVLAVPAEAVLTTGRRQLVYLEIEPGKYQVAEPKLGPRAGDYYPVLDGLKQGDRVVARSSFLLDSQFQITGKTCLLYPDSSALSTSEDSGQSSELSAKERSNIELLPESERPLAVAQKICPITDKHLGSMGKPYKMEIRGRILYLCCKGCVGAVEKDPEAAFKKVEAAKQDSTHSDPH